MTGFIFPNFLQDRELFGAENGLKSGFEFLSLGLPRRLVLFFQGNQFLLLSIVQPQFRALAPAVSSLFGASGAMLLQNRQLIGREEGFKGLLVFIAQRLRLLPVLRFQSIQLDPLIFAQLQGSFYPGAALALQAPFLAVRLSLDR